MVLGRGILIEVEIEVISDEGVKLGSVRSSLQRLANDARERTNDISTAALLSDDVSVGRRFVVCY